MSDIIKYNETHIDFTADRLCMTHMWKAAGGDTSKRPNDWLTQTATKEFIGYLETTTPGCSLTDTKEGRNGGTWGHWKVAMAYAKYLSLEFHNWCLEVVREKFEKKASSTSFALDKINKLEEHVGKLAARGLITEDQALDAITILWRQECGIDLTQIPSLRYNQLELSSAGSVSVPATDTTLFPLTAYRAGHNCKDLLDAYRSLLNTVERKRFKTELKSYATPFCDVLRDLNLHPHSSQGYVATDASKESSRAYCLEVPQSKNITNRGVQTVKIIKVVQFNTAAVDRVRGELTRRIADLTARAATSAVNMVN